MLGSAILVQPVLTRLKSDVGLGVSSAGVWYEQKSGARHVGPKMMNVVIVAEDRPGVPERLDDFLCARSEST